MRMFAGLKVGFKRTAVYVVSESGGMVRRVVVDTWSEALARALEPWRNELSKVGLGERVDVARRAGQLTPIIGRTEGLVRKIVIPELWAERQTDKSRSEQEWPKLSPLALCGSEAEA